MSEQTTAPAVREMSNERLVDRFAHVRLLITTPPDKAGYISLKGESDRLRAELLRRLTAATERPAVTPSAGRSETPQLRAMYIWDGDAGEHQLYVEGKSIDWPHQQYVNTVLGPFETRFVYLCQSSDDITNALYEHGILWSEEIRGLDFTDYDGGWNDATSTDQWEALWSKISALAQGCCP